jgi:Uma2 family endonuclease
VQTTLEPKTTPKPETTFANRKRFTVQEYEQMEQAGFFQDVRVELIDGEIFQIAAIGMGHAVSVDQANDELRTIFKRGYRIRVQSPLAIGESRPEPDIAVVRGFSAKDFLRSHPTTAVLIVEVSEFSLPYDRDYKGSLYASAGILEYWVLNLIERCLEVYREPDTLESVPFGYAYLSKRIYKPEETVSPLEKPDAKIKVANLLP